MNRQQIFNIFSNDDAYALDLLIRHSQFNVNSFDNLNYEENSYDIIDYDDVPIIIACKRKAIKCLQVLLQHGAVINKKINVQFYTYSIIAYVVEFLDETVSLGFQLEAIKLLLDYGAELISPFHIDYLRLWFQYPNTELNVQIIQLLFMYGLQYQPEIFEHRFLLDNNIASLKFYSDWPIIINLFCLEKKGLHICF